MDKFLSLAINGAVSGAVYGLLASGLVVGDSTSGVFNLGHGALAFAVAFLFYQLNTGLDWPIVPAALLCIVVVSPLLGWALDRLLFGRLSRASVTARIVGTIGLLIAVPSLVLWIVERINAWFSWSLPSGDNVGQPPGIGPTPKVDWHPFASVTIDSNQLAIFGTAALAALLLWWLLTRTRTGLRMRAIVDRPELAALRGANPKRTSTLSWVISSVLAGVAGVVAAPILNLDQTAFTVLLFVAATAAVYARFRSVPIAFAAGLGLGIIQNLVAGYGDFANNVDGVRAATPFILLFAGLVFLGRSGARRAGSVADDPPPPDPLRGLNRWRRMAPWAVGTAALVVFTLVLANDFWVGLVVQGLCLAIVLLSFTVVTGLGGMVSLAQATFVTSAGLTAGYLMTNGSSYFVGLVAGTAVALVVGLLVALPTLRLGGLALALATLALALLGDQLVFQLASVNNDQAGYQLPRPTLGPLDLGKDRVMAMVVLVLLGLVILLVRNLQRSAWGRALVATRTSEAAAASVGISPTRARLATFGVSAAIAGFGGVLLASYNANISGTAFPATTGLVWLAVVVLWGVRRPAGAVIGGLVYFMFPQVLSWFTDSTLLSQALFGLGAIGLATDPEGFLSTFNKAFAAIRERLGAARAPAPAPVAASAAEARPVGPAEVPAPDSDGLVVTGVRAGYGEVEVLHDVSLSVPAGTMVALLGPNGAGKTTLCRVVAGQVAPAKGTVCLAGRDLAGSGPDARASSGLVLAPESRGVFPSLTVEDNLRMWLASAEERQAAYDHFPVLGERRRQVAGHLSGGEQQMLSLAPLLVRRPEVLVVDEPSLGLAPLVVGEVFGILGRLREQGVTVLVVEEKATHALEAADHVAFLELGRIRWQGPAAEAGQAGMGDIYLGAGRS